MGSLFSKLWPFRSSSPAPRPKPLPLLGLGTHSLEQPVLDDLLRMGVRRIRHPIYLHDWRDNEPYREWKKVRLGAALEQGFEVLIVVLGAEEGYPFTEDEYLNDLSTLVQTFPGVAAWQVLNEKTLHGADGTATGLLQSRAYSVVKAANPQAAVVTMALDPASPWGKAFFATKPRADAVAMHVYGWPLKDFMRRAVDSTLGLDPGYEVWVTEFGSATSIIPHTMHDQWETLQKQEIAAGYEAARGVSRAYIYQYQTDEAGRHSDGETHGIVREADNSWRPAAYWLSENV